MGYSPAKLRHGDETDQFLPSVGFSRHLIDCAKYILIGGAVVLTMITGAKAIDTGIQSQDQLHLEYKIYLDENTNPDADDDISWEEYQASQQANTGGNANKVLAAAYGRKLMSKVTQEAVGNKK